MVILFATAVVERLKTNICCAFGNWKQILQFENKPNFYGLFVRGIRWGFFAPTWIISVFGVLTRKQLVAAVW